VQLQGSPLADLGGCVAKTGAAGARVGNRCHFLFNVQAQPPFSGVTTKPNHPALRALVSQLPTSYRQVAEMVNERGIDASHNGISLGTRGQN